MKNKNHIKTCLWGGLLLTLLAGCSGSDGEETVPTQQRAKTRQLTITEQPTSTAIEGKASTRARVTLTEDDSRLAALWTAGDGLTYCNLSMLATDQTIGLAAPTSGPLTATTSAAISLFTGSVTCDKGDLLTVVYPAAAISWGGVATAQYTIALGGQDGTLETLARKYHHVYGVATVQSVAETTANATMPKMKSLLTACKFSFVDKATGDPISIKQLQIAYDNDGTDGSVGTYPQTATVVCGQSQADVHAQAVANSGALTVTLATASSEAYVALLPTTGQRTFRFTVTTADGSTYTGTARATLTEGEYVAATGLRLAKQE